MSLGKFAPSTNTALRVSFQDLELAREYNPPGRAFCPLCLSLFSRTVVNTHSTEAPWSHQGIHRLGIHTLGSVPILNITNTTFEVPSSNVSKETIELTRESWLETSAMYYNLSLASTHSARIRQILANQRDVQDGMFTNPSGRHSGGRSAPPALGRCQQLMVLHLRHI